MDYICGQEVLFWVSFSDLLQMFDSCLDGTDWFEGDYYSFCMARNTSSHSSYSFAFKWCGLLIFIEIQGYVKVWIFAQEWKFSYISGLFLYCNSGTSKFWYNTSADIRQLWHRFQKLWRHFKIDFDVLNYFVLVVLFLFMVFF